MDRRTPQGAVTTATTYGLAFDGPGVLDPDRRSELIQEFAAEEARDDLEEALAGAAGLLTSRLRLSANVLSDDTFVWRVAPAGWQLRSYDADRAVVAVWATGIAMAGGRPLARPGWRTTEVELVWERGAWRLVAFRTEPGPEPPAAGDETAGRAAGREMNRFEQFTHQPAGGSPP